MRFCENFIITELIGDRFGHEIVGVNEWIAAGSFFYAIDEDTRFIEAHVLFKVGAFQIERQEIVWLRLDCLEEEISLLDRIPGLAVVISAPFVAALLRFN